MKKILIVLMMVFLVVTLSAKEKYVQPLEDISPTAGISTNNASNATDEMWDVLYTFDNVGAGKPGIETNGMHIFTTDWRVGEITFQEFEMDGTPVEQFDIADATEIRDMAYDGEYFYGAAADMSLKKMDLENQTLVETINATCTGVTGIRHIAYDPELDGGNGGFWIGNWGDFGAITMTGEQIYANIAGIAESTYGSAYDPWTEGGPYLWLFCQTGSLVELKQFEIATQSLTGVMHDASDMPGFNAGSAGGCATYVNDDGLFALLVNIQQDPNLIGAYELAVTADPMAPGQPTDLAVIPDAGGALSADIAWLNPSLTVDGSTLTELTSVELYRGDELIYTSSAPVIGGAETYTDDAMAASGTYEYSVIPYNSYGDGLPASASAWIGEDMPSAVTELNVEDVSTDDLAALVSWVNPTEGLHGGPFNEPILGYHVTRSDGEDFELTGSMEEWTDDSIEDPGIYAYTVIPYNVIGDGPATTSAQVGIGITVTQVGNAETTDYQIPMNIYYQNSIVEVVYDKEWIGTDMLVNTVAFHAAGITSTINPFYLEIWLGEVDIDNLSAGFLDDSQLTNVYSGTIDVPTGDYWLEIPLDTPFEYEFTDNLVMGIVKDDDEYFSTSDVWWTTESGTADRTIHQYSDSEEFNVANPPTSPMAKTTYPDVRFYYSALAHGNVDGTVTNSTNGSPVEGAIVQVGGYPPVTTNAAGEYMSEEIVTGVHPITCVKDGFYDYESEVEVIAGETTTHDIDIVPNLYGNLDGIVTDLDTGDPIEGAEIIATSDFEVEYTTSTGADGSYLIEDMIAGMYTVECSAEDHASQEVEDVEIEDGITTTLDFALAWLEGMILIWDPDPTPSGEMIVPVIEDYTDLEVEYTTTLGTIPENCLAIFGLFGIYSNNYVCLAGSPEAAAIEDFIANGGSCYLEGGDMWYYDPQYQGGHDFGPTFGLVGLSDSGGTIPPITGIASFWAGMTWNYTGENSWIDELGAAGGEVVMQGATPVGVANDTGTYTTVGASFEITGMCDTASRESFEIAVLNVLSYFMLYNFESGNLEGTVTDLGTGAPIEDATVTIGSLTGSTNASGYYLIEDIITGTYDVSCTADGYNTATEEDVVIELDATTVQDWGLLAPEMSVDPTSLTVSVPQNQTDEEILTVTNNGLGVLDYATSIEFPDEANSVPTIEPNYDYPRYFERYENSFGPAPESNAPAAHGNSAFDFLRDAVAYGEEVMTNNWYSYDTGTMSSTMIGPAGYSAFAGDFGNQGFFAIDYNTDNLLQIDPDTGAETVIGNMPCPLAGSGGIWSVLTCNRLTGEWYAVAVDLTVPSPIYSVDITTAEIEQVGEFSGIGIISGAIDQNGMMYCADLNDDNAYSMNMSDYSSNLLGPLGYDANYAQGAGYDPNDDILYLAAYGVAAELRIMDRETGATTVVGTLPDETGAFGFAGSLESWLQITDGASGTVDPTTSADVTVTFDATDLSIGDVLNANIIFTSSPDVGTISIPVEMTVGQGSTGPEPSGVTTLYPCFPNPVKSNATFRFSLKEPTHVNLSVYNVRGQLVERLVSEKLNADEHSVSWNGTSNGQQVGNGIYYYKLETENKTFLKKMVLMK